MLTLEPTTIATLKSLGIWLKDSSTIMFNIETVSVPTSQQMKAVGMEWAATLSRLE